MESKSIWTKVEEHIIKWMVGLAGGAILIAIAFYFNTNHVMAQNTATNIEQTKDIKLIKDDVQRIKTVPVINQQQIKSIKRDVDRLEKTMNKNNEKTMEKMDKIIDVLLELKRK